MKKLILICVPLLVLIISCNKQDMQKPVTANNVDNATVSKLKLLSGHPWKYTKLIYQYDPQTKTGNVVYNRKDPANNTLQLDDNRIFYAKLGGYDEVDGNGTHSPGTWQFSTDSTKITINYTNHPPANVVYTVKTLSATQLIVTYRIGTTLRFASFSPAKPE
jgi:hypothetical protein